MKGRRVFNTLVGLAMGIALIGPALTPMGSLTVHATEKSNVEVDMTGLNAFALSQVELRDDYFINAYDKEVLYLTSFDTDKLLAGFRETAGVDMKGATRYPGWENMLIGGHTLGHYMTACVKSYESANCSAEDREKLFAILGELTYGLKECQDNLGTGFLFGATILDAQNVEKQFDNVEKNRSNIITEAWVPWYTMHKIFEGFVSVANMDSELLAATLGAGVDEAEVAKLSQTAKEVVSNLADWVYGRTSSWSEATRKTVLGIEYGGMNDCLYDVYLLTGKEEHLAAAHAFDQTELFDRVKNGAAGEDVLNNLHANTTIPKFMGALKRYVVTGEQLYLEYATSFWDMVVENHSYITGGNSEWEHFGQDNILDKERTNCNCETCNSYNMLKMTKLLFMLTGDGKYGDWYEGTFLNSIMSSQNPETGMTTYFQPMSSGYFKVYGEPYTKFWCCTGSGMENFSKLQESFYYYKEDMLVVNQYISSSVNWNGYVLEQEAHIPESEVVTLTLPQGFSGKLLLRLPNWLAADAQIKVNGQSYSYAVTGNSYAVLEGTFEAGAVVEVTLPMEVVAYSLPDGENTYAFKYGPVVLSALLGTEDMAKGVTGVDVTIPSEKILSEKYLPSGTEKITVTTDTVEEFMQRIDEFMEKAEGDSLSFNLQGTDANLTFVTHYKQHQERYGIYFRFSDDHSEMDAKQYINDKKVAREEAYRIDTVQPGYGQYENDSLHNMQESGEGSVGSTENGTTRYAKAGGAFSYTMLIDHAGTDLLATFDSADDGKTLKITVEDVVIYEGVLDSKGETGYYDVVLPVCQEALAKATKTTFDGQEREVLTFTFQGSVGADGVSQQSGALCEFLYTMQSMSDDCEIVEMSAEEGALYYSESKERFLLRVAAQTQEVKLNVALPSAYSYLTVDGVAKEEKNLTLALSNGIYTNYTLTVWAEDFAHCKEYTLVIQKVVAEDEDQTGEGTEDGKAKDAYYVDCGDHGPDTMTEGSSFGTHQSKSEQLYGVDKQTGYFWGLVDDPEDLYNGSAISAGLYTANTWCYEQNSCKDGLRIDVTNRYTKNQYESDIPRHIDYRFELEDGTYKVEVGFVDPWGCSKNPSIYAYYGTDKEQLLVKNFDVLEEIATAKVQVTDGVLDLNFKSQDKAINITYIRIVPLEVTSTDEKDYVLLGGTEPPVSETDKTPAEGSEQEPLDAADGGAKEPKTGNTSKGVLVAAGAAVVAVIGAAVVWMTKKRKK